ncbi:MAG TPA: diadenylate cyclase [Polyangia bacterium]|jgi:uncharacterized protein (TIGR00159 family)
MDARSIHALARGLRWQDAVDVFLLTLLFTRLYAWTRRTAAVQVACGLLLLVALSWTASHMGLILTSYLLSAVGAVATVIVVVVFQQEIRRGLNRVSPLRWLAPPRDRRGSDGGCSILAKAAFVIAARHKGALIVVERRDRVAEHSTAGTALDAHLSSSMLEAVFTSTSPLHDGAVVVEGDRIARASVVLPLATDVMAGHGGTRHRAALGLSARCDALVICVSEETGEVSLATDGQLLELPDARALEQALMRLGAGSPPPGPRARRRPLRLLDLGPHAAIFCGVLIAWAAMALDRSHAVGRIVPLEIRGFGEGITFDPPRFTSVAVELRSSRRELELLPPDAVEAYVDLSGASPGTQLYRIQTDAPAGIEVVSTVPSSIQLQVKQRRPTPTATARNETMGGVASDDPATSTHR